MPLPLEEGKGLFVNRDNAMRHILVVEDSEGFANLIKKRFQVDANTRVTILDSGEKVIDFLSRYNGVHVLVVDMNLPGMNGIDLYLALKDLYNRTDSKITKKYHKMMVLVSEDYEAMSAAEAHKIGRVKKPCFDDPEQEAKEWFTFMQIIEQKIAQTESFRTIKDIEKNVGSLRILFDDLSKDTTSKLQEARNETKKDIQALRASTDEQFAGINSKLDIMTENQKAFQESSSCVTAISSDVEIEPGQHENVIKMLHGITKLIENNPEKSLKVHNVEMQTSESYKEVIRNTPLTVNNLGTIVGSLFLKSIFSWGGRIAWLCFLFLLYKFQPKALPFFKATYTILMAP